MTNDRSSDPVRRGLKLLGWTATFLACAYFLHALWRLDIAQVASVLPVAAWWGTGAIAAGYGAGLALLALAWLGLADPGRRPALDLAVAIYGPAVIAKYLPGSVFQYASRQWRGDRAGLAQRDMARASLFEAASHVPAAATVAALLASPAGLSAIAALCAFGVALLFVGSSPIVRAVGGQLAFFALFGLLIAATATFVPGEIGPARLASAFMLAWIAGFLVPVAPGGIGVREAVLVAVVGTSPQVAVLAVLTRLVTTIGDGLIGLAGYRLALAARSNRQASE